MLEGGVTRRFFKLSGLVPILVCNVSSFASTKLERLRITLTANGKHEFVPRDEVFPLIVVYCILLRFLLKTTSCFTPVVSIRIVLDSFHLLIFYSKKFST